MGEFYILLCLLGAAIFWMGLPFIPRFSVELSYGRYPVRMICWYGTGILFLLFLTTNWWLLSFSFSPEFIAFIFVNIYVWFFSRWWQSHGKSAMPKTAYDGKTTNLYTMGPHYKRVKVFEILFQDVFALSLIGLIYLLTGDALLTGILFGAFFALTHVTTALLFFGWRWALFTLLMGFVAGTVVSVAYFFVPEPLYLLFAFHYAMYPLYLITVKYFSRS